MSLSAEGQQTGQLAVGAGARRVWRFRRLAPYSEKMRRVSDGEIAYLGPEAKARSRSTGCSTPPAGRCRTRERVNLAASRGVAVREFVMKPPHGRADYLLFVDGRRSGVIEAKKEGETLTGVEWQTREVRRRASRRARAGGRGRRSPFVYESTGAETRFTNRLDPEPRAAPVFSFHRPETLAGWLDEIAAPPDRADAAPPAARDAARSTETGLWPRAGTRRSATSRSRSPRTGRGR